MKDPKSVAVMLLEKKHKAESEGDEATEEPTMPPLEEVMGDFISAVKSGDAAGAAKAFRAAKACADDYSDDEEE